MGYIYVAKSNGYKEKNLPYIKMGKIDRQSPRQRLNNLNRENIHEENEFKYIALYEVPNPSFIEKTLKRYFSNKHLEKEFYDFNNNDINYIRTFILSQKGKEIIHGASIDYSSDRCLPVKKRGYEYLNEDFPQGTSKDLNSIKFDDLNADLYYTVGRTFSAGLKVNPDGRVTLLKGSSINPNPLDDYLDRAGNYEVAIGAEIHKMYTKHTRVGKHILTEDYNLDNMDQAARIVTGSRRNKFNTWKIWR